jgi:hypothetical protein
MAKWGTKGYGAWHPGPDAKAPCEVCQKWHSLQEAVDLNEKEREYKQASMWARHKQWIGGES